jgi:hypothetical protein
MMGASKCAVIPCLQREAVRCRHGILAGADILQDPVSAQRHFMPQRARDDLGGVQRL